MAIFVDADTKVVVQGLTGGQGKYHGLRNQAYGTRVVGGVTPGKGGTDVLADDGTATNEAVAPVDSTASATESNTGMPVPSDASTV